MIASPAKALAFLGATLAMVVLAASLAAAFPPPPPPPPETIRLRFGTIAPEGTPWGDQLKRIKKRIEAESGGRIKVALFLDARLGGEKEMLKDLKRGKLQGGGFSSGAVATVIAPELQVLELPFLFQDEGEADHLIDEVLGADLAKSLEERGVFLAIWGENGWRSIGTRDRPVRKPEELAGMKFRAQEAPVHLAFWKALGATAVPIATDEVPSALETGVIQGFDQTPLYAAAAGWHNSIRYFTLTQHIFQPALVVYNKRFLESLPEDLRAIVLANLRQESIDNRASVREDTKVILEEFAAAKIELIELSAEEREAFRKRAQPIYDEIKPTVGSALLDKARQGLDEYRKRKAAAPPSPGPSGQDGGS